MLHFSLGYLSFRAETVVCTKVYSDIQLLGELTDMHQPLGEHVHNAVGRARLQF